MIISCTECKYRIKCIALCKDAEVWASQDHIGGNYGFPQVALVPDMGNAGFWDEEDTPWQETSVFCREAAEVVGLSKHQIKVMLLRYAGYRYAEIGKLLGISYYGVHHAIKRGRKKLRGPLLTVIRERRTKLRKGGK